jgi:hypothetical protein
MNLHEYHKTRLFAPNDVVYNIKNIPLFLPPTLCFQWSQCCKSEKGVLDPSYPFAIGVNVETFTYDIITNILYEIYACCEKFEKEVCLSRVVFTPERIFVVHVDHWLVSQPSIDVLKSYIQGFVSLRNNFDLWRLWNMDVQSFPISANGLRVELRLLNRKKMNA